MKTIFIVDDDDTNRMVAKTALDDGTYKTFTIPSAEKMFKLLEKIKADMILLDVDMPEMDGYQTIKILKEKEETKNIPVIFLTAKTESGDELEGLSLGAIDYITKPFQPALLLKRIEVHLLVVEQRKTLEMQAEELRFFSNNLRRAFSTYLSEDVVEEIVSDPSRLQLGGVKRHMTAMFTDLQNFTTISEALDPEYLIDLLNYYFTAMSDIILEQKGTIDKYEGDAIISFFGAPLELSDHALRACMSAIMMKRIEGDVNKHIALNTIEIAPMHTRIGINTGDMVVGNMGTNKKMNYTIIGNAVNLASRIEGINKQYGTWVLASENTIKETEGRLLTRQLDRIRVAGINEPVRIHEVLETKADAQAALHEQAELFHKALELFESRNWKDAGELFNQVLKQFPGDGPSLLYQNRCRHYLQDPPPNDWDGVFNFTEK